MSYHPGRLSDTPLGKWAGNGWNYARRFTIPEVADAWGSGVLPMQHPVAACAIRETEHSPCNDVRVEFSIDLSDEAKERP
jgi:hypothetical protein